MVGGVFIMSKLKTKIKIIKRNGNKEDFDPEKIKIAIRKSAERKKND